MPASDIDKVFKALADPGRRRLLDQLYRDKRNPKPLDSAAFHTLVKTAAEVIRRHEQQTHADLHKSVTVTAPAGRITVKLDIVADEDDPYAELSAMDAAGDELARVRVGAAFKLSARSAEAWIENDFRKPARA
jgi:DNA-binding transcriptional ArsR family regulator